MNNTLHQFKHEEFGSIRAIEIDGEPWFVGKDVADALGYTNSNKALIDHVDDEDKRIIQRSRIVTLEIPNRGMTFINESGLYSLILSSKLPTAKKFRRWVTSEVLPSIRKHGAYATEDVLNEALANPDFAMKLLHSLAQERQKNDTLTQEKNRLAPKARYCDLVLFSQNTVPISLIAKDYGLSAVRFNQLLHDLGVQFKVGGAWVLYQKYADQGYTKSYTHYVGDRVANIQTRWTQLGRMFIYHLLAWNGIRPMMEYDQDRQNA